MTQLADSDVQRLSDWIGRVAALAGQVEQWSRSQGWNVDRQEKEVQEKLLGQYRLPLLRIEALGGELHLNPIGLHIIGGNGRVDLEAFPTLSRVKLIGENGGWKIMTDSNVPLRLPWESGTFVQLAHDLLS